MFQIQSQHPISMNWSLMCSYYNVQEIVSNFPYFPLYSPKCSLIVFLFFSFRYFPFKNSISFMIFPAMLFTFVQFNHSHTNAQTHRQAGRHTQHIYANFKGKKCINLNCGNGWWTRDEKNEENWIFLSMFSTQFNQKLNLFSKIYFIFTL